MKKNPIFVRFAGFASLSAVFLLCAEAVADMPNAKGLFLTPQSYTLDNPPALQPERKSAGTAVPAGKSVSPEDVEASCLMAKNHCQSVCLNRFAGIKDDAEFYKDSAHQLKLFEKRRCLATCNKELNLCVRGKN
jgi:hypothetical protein